MMKNKSILKKGITAAAAAVCSFLLICSGAQAEEEKQEEQKDTFIVAVDPGHQGYWVDMSAQEPNGPGSSVMKTKCTTGTEGKYTGVPEYQLNLDISLALEKELAGRGYEVLLTRRDNDTAISNSERALFASDSGADILVRIHANGSDDTSVRGAQVMTISPNNPYNAQVFEDSRVLGEDILQSYCRSTGFADLGIMYVDDMTGLNWSSIPSIILEMGFMSNQDDDYAMQDPDMQKNMVKGVADGIDQYFGREYKEEQNVEAAEKNAEDDRDIETLNMENVQGSMNEERDIESIEGTGVPAGAQDLPPVETQDAPAADEDLTADMQELADQYLRDRESRGQVWAVSIENLTDGGTDGYHENVRMQTASVIKVFIMGAVYEHICYPSDDIAAVDYQESYDGELRGLLEQMITVSDNTAANSLVSILGEGDFEAGKAVVNEYCRRHGFTQTHLGRKFLDSNPTDDNYTCAADCRRFLSEVYHGEMVCEEASGKMLGLLKGQTVKHKIPSGLPSGYASANKTGEMPEGYGLGCIENDIAVIFAPDLDYVLVVLSNELGGDNDGAMSNISGISSFVASKISDWTMRTQDETEELLTDETEDLLTEETELPEEETEELPKETELN